MTHAQAALGARAHQQVLGLDPAHRGGELPGQELDQQQAGELAWTLGPLRPGLQDLARRLGGHDLEDAAHEVRTQLEGTCHQVGHVAPHQALIVQVLGHELQQAAAEGRHARAQHLGVEGDVDAGHEHEGVLAPAGLGAPAAVRGQRLQARDRASHRVLGPSQVVVDDLEELTAGGGDGGDVVLNLAGAHAGLVRAQGTHAVARAALGVTLDQGVHRGPALEDDGDRGLHVHDVAVGRQGRVLTQGVAGKGRVLDQGPGLRQSGGGGHGHRGQGNLGELGEVEQPLGVSVGDTARGHLHRVVTHEVDDRETELGAGEGVRALPHLAGRTRAVHLVQAHPDSLDALTRVEVGRRLGRRQGGSLRDDVAADLAGHLQDVAAPDHEAGALDADDDLVLQLDRAEHDVGPALQDEARSRGVGGSSRLLRGGRQPHAVHQRCLHPSHPGGVIAGVDGVVVPAHASEGGHIRRSLDRDASQQPPGAAHSLPARATGQIGGAGGRRAVGAAPDGKALTHEGDQLALPLP